MKKLSNLLSGKPQIAGALVRCVDWDYSIQYFRIHYYDEMTSSFVGKLDSGHYFKVHSEHGFWVIYEEGMENIARAV